MCTPNGIRTRVAAVKGRCPRPLDDGGRTDREMLSASSACPGRSFAVVHARDPELTATARVLPSLVS